MKFIINFTRNTFNCFRAARNAQNFARWDNLIILFYFFDSKLRRVNFRRNLLQDFYLKLLTESLRGHVEDFRTWSNAQIGDGSPN